jgi:hypothetical protein
VRSRAHFAPARELLYRVCIMKRKDELQTIENEKIEQVSGGRYWGPGWGGWGRGGGWGGYWGGGWNANAWNSYATALAMASLYNSYNSGPNVYYVY